VINDNPYLEALFRILKYRPELPVKPFSGLLQARRWTTDLVHWYNQEQRHFQLDDAILNNRAKAYAAAHHPSPPQPRHRKGTKSNRTISRLKFIKIATTSFTTAGFVGTSSTSVWFDMSMF
jgi:hypothetical protein